MNVNPRNSRSTNETWRIGDMRRRTYLFIVVILLLGCALNGCTITANGGLSAPATSIIWTDSSDDHLPKELTAQQVYDAIVPAIVEIHTFDENRKQIGTGTGFFVNEKGEIITNFHVLEGADSASIKLFDGAEYEITGVRDYNIELDLARIFVETENESWLEIDDGEVQTGDTVYAIGSSLGLTNTFSSGIVSQASRLENGVSWIQTTAPISPGNSGGPLVSSRGKVIGVNTWYVKDSQNLNFAVSAKEINKLSRVGNEPVSHFSKYNNPTILGCGQRSFILNLFYLDGRTEQYLIRTEQTYVGDALYELGVIGKIPEDVPYVGIFPDSVFGEEPPKNNGHPTMWHNEENEWVSLYDLLILDSTVVSLKQS